MVGGLDLSQSWISEGGPDPTVQAVRSCGPAAVGKVEVVVVSFAKQQKKMIF